MPSVSSAPLLRLVKSDGTVEPTLAERIEQCHAELRELRAQVTEAWERIHALEARADRIGGAK